MKAALLGSIHFWKDTCNFLQKYSNVEPVACIFPFKSLSGGGAPESSLDVVSVDEAICMYHEKKIDSIVVANIRIPDYGLRLMMDIIRTLKISGVNDIFLLLHYPYHVYYAVRLYKLDPEKAFLYYIETHLVDGCNLNCKSCGHLASLFSKDDICPIDEFRRDMRELSKKIDLAYLRLMGGEPFLLKNLDEYCDIAREYFPNAEIILVSNGLLIPQTSDKVLDSIVRNGIIVDITQYPPTVNIKDKIVETLTNKKILYCLGRVVDTFMSGVKTVPTRSDTNKSRRACGSDVCHFLRHGKVYKCPGDALRYRYEELFPGVVPHVPYTMPADIYSTNFVEMLDLFVDRPIKMCEFCAEQAKLIPWSVQNNPTAEDWM